MLFTCPYVCPCWEMLFALFDFTFFLCIFLFCLLSCFSSEIACRFWLCVVDFIPYAIALARAHADALIHTAHGAPGFPFVLFYFVFYFICFANTSSYHWPLFKPMLPLRPIHMCTRATINQEHSQLNTIPQNARTVFFFRESLCFKANSFGGFFVSRWCIHYNRLQ